jgi:hypothetical protein
LPTVAQLLRVSIHSGGAHWCPCGAGGRGEATGELPAPGTQFRRVQDGEIGVEQDEVRRDGVEGVGTGHEQAPRLVEDLDDGDRGRPGG